MSELNPHHKLGNLCRRGHDHEGTGQSVRFTSDGHCVACRQERVRAHRGELSAYEAKRRLNNPRPRGTGSYLGQLCKRGHEHEDSGGSLRYASTAMCIVCNHLADKAWRAAHPAEYRAQTKAAMQRWKKRDPGGALARAQAKLTYSRSDGGRQARLTWYARTRPARQAYARLANRRRYASRQGVVHIPYTLVAIDALFMAYAQHCAYCGGPAREVDHVVPLHLKGHDALYNLAPACRGCNASKGKRCLEEWYPQQPFFSVERLHFMADQQVAAGLPSMATVL